MANEPIPSTLHPYVLPPPLQLDVHGTRLKVARNRGCRENITILCGFFGCFFSIAILFFILDLFMSIPPQFHVETVTISNLNISSNSLISGNWDVHLIVQNPNSNTTLYYVEIKASLYYKSISISETNVSPFEQGTKNETTIRATFATFTSYSDDQDRFNGEMNHGVIDFRLWLTAWLRSKTSTRWGAIKDLTQLWVYCPGLSIKVSANKSSGSLVGGSKECMTSPFLGF